MGDVRRGKIPFDSDVAEASYQCLTCRACTDYCELHVDVPEILRRVRHKAIQSDLAPDEISGFLDKFQKFTNPFAKDLLEELKTILPKKHFKRDASTIYFPGCTATAQVSETVTDTFSLFEKLGIDFVGCYDDTIQCCGYPLHALGDRDEFIDLAEINYNSLKKFKTIIVGSPTCTHTLKTVYAKYDFDLKNRVITINRFLEPYLKNINYRIRRGAPSKIMYHDPCYQSRYLKESELPREMLSLVSGYAPVEFEENRDRVRCSGQGGCFGVKDKDAARQMTQQRLSEVKEKNVPTLVTQCPTCVHKMRGHGKKITVQDLVSYLNDCIEAPRRG